MGSADSETQPRARYFPNTFPPGLPFDAGTITSRLLEMTVEQNPPVAAKFAGEDDLLGLFAGPTSMAYLFFLLSCPDSSYRDQLIGGKVPLRWCMEYLTCASEAASVYIRPDVEPGKNQPVGLEGLMEPMAPPNPWSCGIVNEQLAWYAVMAIATQERSYVSALLDVLPEVLREDVPEYDGQGGNHEWIYGRAGYLYFLRLIRKYFVVADGKGPVIPHDVTDRVIRRILLDGPDTPRRWPFTKQLYLGAGHGWMGVVTQVLLTDAAGYKEALQPVVERMLQAQLPDGNWPYYVMDVEEQPQPMEDWFVQIGHGAPGMVVSLLALRDRVYTSGEDASTRAKIEDAIERAQDVIWKKGLLTKEPCLQHGATGNALALTDRGRAATFLARSTPELIDEGLEDGSLEASSSAALHRGIAGRAWAFWRWDVGDWGKFVTYTDV